MGIGSGLAMTFIKGTSLRGVNGCRKLEEPCTPKQAHGSEAESMACLRELIPFQTGGLPACRQAGFEP